MPNWKSYESSVRLLSAIVAAHPELKLKYDEVGRFYGGGTTYKSVWGRMSQINKHAETLRDAIQSGIDPITVELNEVSSGAVKPKAKEMAIRFGGDCTKSSLENRFRRIRTDASLMNDAVKKGIDPITLDIGGSDGAVPIKGGVARELAAIMGSDCTTHGIRFQFTDRYKPIAKKQLEMKASGLDPKDVLDHVKGAAVSRDISKYFGSDSTGGGIGFQFRTIKADAKLARDYADAGGDPKDLGIPTSGKEISKYYPEASAFSLQHRFRSILKDAKDMRAAGGPIARHLNDGTTSTALEHRFRPIKKDAEAMKAAIASNYGEENANGGGSAVKAKATPRKRTPAKAKKSSTSDDDEEMETPSKPKSNLHKVASGRVTKTGRASAKAKNYAELSEEDDIEVFKSEPEGFVDLHTGKTPNGRFDLNSQQWSNGGQGDEGEDDYFHDVDQGDEA